MAMPSVPLAQAVQDAINAAPNQRIKHADLAAQLREAGYRNFGMELIQLGQSGQVTAQTEIEDNRGVLYYSPKTA